MTDQNRPFELWIEQYLNNTLSPEDARQLLQAVQEDPEKLAILSKQIQADRLLSVQLEDPTQHQIAQKVLQQIEVERQSRIIRPAFWSTRNISRVAASLFVLLSLTFVIKQAARDQHNKSQPKAAVADLQRENVRIAGADNEELPASQPVDGRTEFIAQVDSISEPQPAKSKPKAIRSQPTHEAESIESKGPYAAPVVPKEDQSGEMVPLPSLDEEASKPLFAFAGTPQTVKLHQPAPSPKREVYFSRGYIVPETQQPNTERYANVEPSNWKPVSTEPLSTFSIDVDTASYANIRRYLNQGSLPPTDAVRIEEMINYFEYSYPQSEGEAPFSSSMALHSCPWNNEHHLLRVGLQGKSFDADEAKNSNLVFLLDVSGSMSSADKLPLLKQGFSKMIKTLGPNDRVAIVAYAGASGLVLPSTPASDKETILGALNRLQSGGSTAGGAGIELAYRVAADHYIKGGVNRVILASDGDFNVGVSDLDGLQKLIEEKRKTGVFLSVLGFGSGNTKDDTMEMLANKGNGNYYYIDSAREADKVLVRQLRSTLVTIAKDVKIQVEFNPALIRSYRLIGYENRALANQDFADDTKDAGEIGAGHQVTALYELIPIDAPNEKDGIALKYTAPKPEETAPVNTDELLTLKLRYKEPEGETSKLLTFPLNRGALNQGGMDESFRWASSVAAFGEKLRASDHLENWSMNEIIETAIGAIGEDDYGYRRECVELMNKAVGLKGESTDGYPQWQFRK